MIRPIFRNLNTQRDGWDRYFVTTKSGNTDDVDFQNPTFDSNTMLMPVDTKLSVLEYLKITFPKDARLNFKKYVVDCIPEELKKDVVAVEWVYGFFDLYEASFFAEDFSNGNLALFVALLTEKDTGRALPGIRIPRDRKPIGLSDDEWETLLSELRK